MIETTANVGVIGVGSMGRNHARVYRELPSTQLVGVADARPEQAAAVAESYGTRAMDAASLLAAVDAVSVAVPTQYHYDVAREAIDAGVHVLVEKPFVDDADRGRELIDRARDQGVTLQVGHIERFNPAIQALDDIVPDLDVIAIDAQRLGPPIDRQIADDAVLDLMIHDIDVLRSILGDRLDVVDAVESTDDPYVTATVVADGVLATLTASRVTQEKIRTLSITAREARVNVDYINQSVTIHRHSLPEYVETNGDVRFRHESIIERPTVKNGEPLKKELSAFVEAAVTGDEPIVSGEDGLRALTVAGEIKRLAAVRARPRARRIHT